MQRFARWHIWLGWAAAIPLLLWTASGLCMTLRPIEQVRGEDLRRPAPAMGTVALQVPLLASPVERLALSQQHGFSVWVATEQGGNQLRFSAEGNPLPKVSEGEARQLVAEALARPAAITAMRRFEADAAPLDLRKPRPSWQAALADGTHIYIDADTGEVLALRTKYWRIYDVMWGLHIMDPVGREDTSHALLWVFSAIALITSLIGTTLLFRRRRAARIQR